MALGRVRDPQSRRRQEIGFFACEFRERVCARALPASLYCSLIQNITFCISIKRFVSLS